jgi:hypothetical protein
MATLYFKASWIARKDAVFLHNLAPVTYLDSGCS